ncbi:MAG: hypothetical protein H0X30_38520, partial [Anaerolineae bacterium]|nr:hypothetical protein [Anaerolineae bacterium]
MPNLERVPKQPASPIKSAQSPARERNGQISLNPTNLSADALILLQRAVGNQAVQRMLNQS